MQSSTAQTLPRVARVLAPTDFSPAAEVALRWASVVAERLGAELVVLHVVDLNTPALMGPPSAVLQAYEVVRRDAIAAAEEKMRDLATRFGAASTVVREGAPRFEIVDAAAALEADLIVMGTHGRTGLRRVLFGSVAEHVVHHSPVPVMTVRQSEGDTGDPAITPGTKGAR